MTLAAFALVIGGAFVGTGCSDDDKASNNGGSGGQGGTGGTGGGGSMEAMVKLRVIHGSPDAPAVDVYARGVTTPLFAKLGYGAVAPYVEVPAGTYTVDIRPAGAPADSAPVFSTPALMMPGGASITALAAGLIGSTDAANKFRVLPLVEGFTKPKAGTVRVRIIHASADAPAVAIDVGNDGKPEITDFALFADSGAEGVELPANAPLPIGIWAGAPLARVTAFTTPALPDGAELFVIASGLLSSQPRDTAGFSLLAAAPTGAVGFIKQDPVVFALHASPDAPKVDIFAGAAELVDGASFGAMSQPIQVPPSTDGYTLDFFPSAAGSARPTGSPAVSVKTPALEAGERYLAIASGFLAPTGDEPAFRLIALADGFAIDAAKAHVRVVHASPDAPAVDVGPVVGDVLSPMESWKGIAFGESSTSAGLALDASSITVGVAAANSTTPVAAFDLTLAAGMRSFAVAAGALSPSAGQEGFRLIVVDTGKWPWTAASVAAN